jgi:hypothetical protein
MIAAVFLICPATQRNSHVGVAGSVKIVKVGYEISKTEKYSF